MKREILFRGKKQSTGEWVYGSLITNEKPGLHTIAQVNTNPVRNGVLTGWCFGVLPETVGQFTGLTDKNGKRIFEGDIFTDDRCHGDFSNDRYEVRFEDGKFCYGNYGVLSDLCDCVDYIEVVNNIHDNPELL